MLIYTVSLNIYESQLLSVLLFYPGIQAMPLPEALAIISFSLGIITFVQNGVKTINLERHRWKNAEEYLAAVEKRLTDLEEKTREWRRRWIVPDFAADEEVDFAPLFECLWGDVGNGSNENGDGHHQKPRDWKIISTDLAAMDSDIKAFNPKLTSFLKEGPNGRRAKFFVKLKLAVGEREKIDETITALEAKLVNLKEDSDDLFREQMIRQEPDETKEKVREDLETISNRYIRERVCEIVLLKLADTAGNVSQKLYSSCMTEQSLLTTILMLDLFPTDKIPPRSQEVSDSAKRREAIFRAHALNKSISFTFFLLMRNQHPNLLMKTKVEGLCTEINNSRNSLSLAFDEVWEGAPTEKVGFSWEESWFLVSRSYQGSVVDKSKAIKSMLKEYAQRSRVLDTSRTQLAYLLAEFGLLFLKTQWLKGLCRCRLRVLMFSQSSPKSEYIIKPGYQTVSDEPDVANGVAGEHGAQPAANVDDWQCWCQQLAGNTYPFGQRHLPYLGVLLAEIAICRPIKVEANPGGGPVPQLKIGGRDKSIVSIIEMVLNAGGSYDYSRAVADCLQSQLSPDKVGEKELKDFYTGVYIR